MNFKRKPGFRAKLIIRNQVRCLARNFPAILDTQTMVNLLKQIPADERKEFLEALAGALLRHEKARERNLGHAFIRAAWDGREPLQLDETLKSSAICAQTIAAVNSEGLTFLHEGGLPKIDYPRFGKGNN
ncbi:MAG: hypothetical protein R3B54_11335 [Bdellovibrionota bacterium]